jgi:hypothetical protein
LSLPGDLRSFALFVAAVGIVSGGMALHILLSAQILDARVELRTMKADYDATMRQNADLVWQIAEAKSLPAVVARAQALGYRASTDPQYVVRVAVPELDAAPAARLDVAGEQPAGDGPLAWQPLPVGGDASASQPAQGDDTGGWRTWLPGGSAGDADSQLSLPGRWLDLLRFRSSP